MSNIQYTINNVTTSNVTYQGILLPPNTSYTPIAQQQAIFAADPGLIGDVLSGRTTISIGVNSWSGQAGVQVLNAAALFGTTAGTGTTAPINTLQIGGKDELGNIRTIKTDTSGKLQILKGLKSGGVYGNLVLTTGGTTYEAKVGISKLSNRSFLTITALDDVFWGYNNLVTTSTGTPLYKNQTITFEIDPDSSFEVWLVASANNKNVRITESL